MYLKKVKAKNSTYLKLVETIWDKKDKKRIQKTILNIGRLDDLMQNGLPFIVKALSKLVTEELSKKSSKETIKFPDLKDISNTSEGKIFNYGHIAYRNIWNAFNVSNILLTLIKNKKVEFVFTDVVYNMAINQLLKPSSKLQLWNNQNKYLMTNQTIDLQHYYRALDILADNKIKIENYFFSQSRDLFNTQLDIVFYDVTTFYFESQKQDQLRDFGFDKDNKINNVHIVMGLLIDKTGKPIGYELFKGNTYEGKTMLKVIEKLKKRFNIDTIIIVADRGLNSKLSLTDIRDAGFHYIVSGRLKSMKNKIQQIVFNQDDYVALNQKDLKLLNKYDADQSFKYKVVDYKNEIKYKENPEDKNYKIAVLDEKLICTYSSKRAAKDRKDRERQLDKAKQIVEKNDKSKLKSQSGHKKYVAKNYAENVKEEEFTLVLDENKVKQDEKFDGYYVIQSSKPELTAKEVIENYHYLYKIEESFRIMKTTMRVRPINHWTPKRIEGHFVMCFIAFLLERELELKLIRNNKINAPEQIKAAINSMTFTNFKIENQDYFLKNEQTKLASDILAVLKIKQPENLQNNSQTDNYMNQYL